MQFEFLFLVTLLFSVMVTTLLIAYAWRYRHTPAAHAFVRFMVCVWVWSFAVVLQLLSVQQEMAEVWHKIHYSAIVVTPVAWMIFALIYAGGQRWVTPAALLYVCVIPAVTLVLLWTNNMHHLFFTEITFTRTGFLTFSATSGGVWMWVHAAYGYLLVAGGIGLQIWVAVRSFRLYRAQAIAIILSALPPLIGNVLVTFGWIRYPVTVIGFVITGLVLGWAIFRYQLLDLGPVARDRLVNSMSDAMFVVDAHRQIVDLNPAMVALLGMPEEQVIGQDAGVVLNFSQDMVKHFLNAAPIQDEILLDQGGEARVYDLRLTLLADKSGTVTGQMIVLHDITKRKQSEEALRRYAEELESSNAELDAFAHTVAHDLKNPLATIYGFASYLESRTEKLSEEKLHENLEHISQTSLKMTNIIDELLLLARVRRVDAVDVQPLDMARIVAEAQKRLHNVITEHRAELSAPSEWPSVWGYPPWIEEVWVNYISNACKYGGHPDGGIAPRIELGFDNTSTLIVRFWVKDNGPGLTDEQRRQLFTPFTRLQQTRAQGHGLGLSIVRRIVEKLGGEVGVESVEGIGSTFWFTLPYFEIQSK
ncbi:MAG: PAS domain S-box protein [Anaerolineae bacterium]|nr:PAS domain S-box protein [Anaerolineae bacterium]